MSLPKELKSSPFTNRRANRLGVSAHDLALLVDQGQIDLIARGVYIASNIDLSEEKQFQAATLLVGNPSAICLISALFQYGLTDTIPKKTWIMVPAIKRSQHSILKLQRIKDPRWNTGIVEQNGYCITSIERTVVEALCARNRIGTQIAIEALRKAVNSKKTSLAKIMSMAKQLDVIHRILPYIEALS